MMSLRLDLIDIAQMNRQMEAASPGDILAWAWEVFKESLVVSSSFQTQSIPLLHMVSKAIPRVPVLFIDTGFHFPETLAFRDQMVERFNLNMVVKKPAIYGKDFVEKFGPMYTHDPDTCCFHNKVVPFQLELRNYEAWVSGIRRDQTDDRKNAQVIDQHPSLEIVKINPMLNWSSKDIYHYIEEHHLPRHPLWESGYRSIGCQQCTSPVKPDGAERDGRWPDTDKNECGVH